MKALRASALLLCLCLAACGQRESTNDTASEFLQPGESAVVADIDNGKSVYAFSSDTSLAQGRKYLDAQDRSGLVLMTTSGAAVLLSPGTPLKVLREDVSSESVDARIASGPYQGKEVYLLRFYVSR